MNKTDKNIMRKLARELWDTIVDVFTDNSAITVTSKRQEPVNLQSTGPNKSTPYDASNFFSSTPAVPPSTATSNTSVIAPRDTQMAYFNRELIREFFFSIKNKLVKNIIISYEFLRIFSHTWSQSCVFIWQHRIECHVSKPRKPQRRTD